MEGQRIHNEAFKGVASDCNETKSGNLVNFKLTAFNGNYFAYNKLIHLNFFNN